MWGATGRVTAKSTTADFNSRPRVGGDAPTKSWPTTPRLFQFTPQCRGRLCETVSLPMRCVYFNSRPRVGGDPGWAGDPPPGTYFNSRPRVGGDEGNVAQPEEPHISIPAPVWGATIADIERSNLDGYFNSHPRAGGDRPHLLDQPSRAISIPAPVRGAT